jgi:hypothetical protein
MFVLYGGADPDNIQTGILDPADVFYDQVMGHKPLAWNAYHPTYGGTPWVAKTGFEIGKNLKRGVFDRCRTKNNWVNAQNGMSMLIQNLSDGNSNYLANRTDDIVVRNHWFDNCANGVNVAAGVTFGGPGTEIANPAARIVFDNILHTRSGGARDADPAVMQNISGPATALGRTYQISGTMQGVELNRITADTLDSGCFLTLSGSGATGLKLTNIVARGGTNGIQHAEGAQAGNVALDTFCSAGPKTVDGNVIYDLTGINQAWFAGVGDTDETNSSMQFEDYANYDYRLQSGSPQRTKGVDGGVPGCDIDALTAMLSGVTE